MRTLHLACVALGFVGCACASTEQLDITEYSHTSYGPAQGTPARPAVLEQTPDGFLWLGTAAGLYRFDGVRFERIKSVGGVQLLGDYITALQAPRSGGLWIGYEFGGASFLDSPGLRNYPPEKGGLTLGTTESFAIDPDGLAWAGTTRGLIHFDGKRWTDVTQTLGLSSPYTPIVMVDKSGDLWIESGGKIALLRRGSRGVHVYALSTDQQGFMQDSAGRVWTMTRNPNCLYLLDPTRDDTPPCRRLPDVYTDSLLIDRTGGLWLAAANRLSVLPIPSPAGDLGARAAERESVPEPRFLSFADGAPPASALEDREGNLWFGTTLGLEQLRVTRLRRHGPFSEPVVLGAGSHNSLWVATTHDRPVPGDDLYQMKGGLMIPYRGGPNQITASYRDATGVLWLGGYGRLWKLNESTWEEIAAPPRELANSQPGDALRTQAIARDPKGDLWLSLVRVGLFRLRNRQWERVPVASLPAPEFPIAIYPDGGRLGMAGVRARPSCIADS